MSCRSQLVNSTRISSRLDRRGEWGMGRPDGQTYGQTYGHKAKPVAGCKNYVL